MVAGGIEAVYADFAIDVENLRSIEVRWVVECSARGSGRHAHCFRSPENSRASVSLKTKLVGSILTS